MRRIAYSIAALIALAKAYHYLFGCFLVAVALLAQSGHRDIPPTDDPNHEGQPSWCQNDDGGGYMHNCHCRAMSMAECPEDPDEYGNTGRDTARCSTFCRKKACRCHSACTSWLRLKRGGAEEACAR